MFLRIKATPTGAFTYAICFVLLLLSTVVHAQLKADFTPSKTSDCESLITKFNDNSTGNPVSWQWNLGNGFTSTEKSPSASYTSPGTFTVTLTVKDAAGNTNTATKTVTVWEKPKPDFTASPAKGCIPFDVRFTDKSDPVSGSIATYSWDFGDGAIGSGSSPVHTYNNVLSATATLTITTSNGCTASKQISNIVEAAPALVAGFNVSNNFLCAAPGAITVANTSTGPGNLTYQWDFGDGGTASGATPGSHTYAAKGVYKVKLTVTSDKGCTSTQTSGDINVANFKTDFQLPASMCENEYPVIFLSANEPKLSNVAWSVDKGEIYAYEDGASYYPAGAGTVKVTMTADYGTCQKVVTKDFVVKPAPVAHFETDQKIICDVPATLKLIDKSQGATSWRWDFGNGQTSNLQNPSVTYSQLGYFGIQLTVGNASGCTNEVQYYVNVAKTEVHAGADLLEGCEGLTPTFSSSISEGDSFATYEWDFGDGSPKSTEATPSHTYNKEGTYPVKLTYTTTNGCKGTVNLYPNGVIEVRKRPAIDFSSPQAPQICGNNWVNFNSTTDVGNSWTWDFGDYSGGSGPNTAHSYKEPGTYTVSLTVANFGCSQTVTKTAYIKAVTPFPRFYMQNLDCNRRTEISFDEQSLGPITSWKWNWGDGKENIYTTKTSPVKHTYDKTGAYMVKLTVTDGTCTSSDSLSFNVYAPSPITIATDKSTLCANETLKASVTSIDRALYDPYYYAWSSSDGTRAYWDYYSSQSASFTNLQPGSDTIRMVAYNLQGCPDSSNKVVVNVHGPVAKFIPPDVLDCRGTELTFTDQTDVSMGKPVKSWSWNFGDGGPAKVFTAPPFKYTYNKSGYFTARLTVTDEDGCTSSATGNLQVNGPNADFAPSSVLVAPGSGVWFYNYTTETGGYATYEWDFGDNTTSTEYGPYKVYPDRGLYTIKLLVKDDNGCTDSARKQIKVSSVSANFTVTTEFVNNSGCPPVLARFTNASVNYESSYWDFGDGSFSTLRNPSHTYTYAGKYIVTLKVLGDAGTEDVYEHEVEVKGPFASIVTSSDGGCLTKEIEFNVSASAAAVNFAWDFTDGIVLETTDPTIKHTFKEPGIYKPRLILSDVAGCKGTAFTKDPIVIDKLDVQLNAEPAFVCDEGWISFKPTFSSYSIDELKKEAAYKWTYEAGLQSENDTTATPRFYLDKIKGYDFTLTTTTAYGCTQTVSKTIHAYPKPELVISGPPQACQDAPVSFSATVSKVDDVNWKWDFGNGNTGNVQQPADQLYSKTGPAEVALIGISTDGCSDTARHSINILPKPVINATSAADFVCLGNSTTLSAGGGISYEWTPALGLSDPQAPDPVAAPEISTTYQVSVTDANGCNNTDEVSIRVAQPFTIQATPDTILCLGHVLPLWVSGADHYVWKGEGLDAADRQYPNATINEEGSYTYEVTGYDADACFTHDTSLVVTVHPSPTINAGPDYTAMAGEPVTLIVQGSGDIVKWNWTPAEYLSCATCPRPQALPNLSTNYTVEVENGYGCKATDALFIHVTCNKGAVFLPNAFTPNKDGKNEWFYPKGRGIKEVKWMRVYDRWGTLVFERTHFQINAPTAGWDGTWKDRIAPIGTYVYAIEAMCEEDTVFLFKGIVTVVK